MSLPFKANKYTLKVDISVLSRRPRYPKDTHTCCSPPWTKGFYLDHSCDDLRGLPMTLLVFYRLIIFGVSGNGMTRAIFLEDLQAILMIGLSTTILTLPTDSTSCLYLLPDSLLSFFYSVPIFHRGRGLAQISNTWWGAEPKLGSESSRLSHLLCDRRA